MIAGYGFDRFYITNPIIPKITPSFYSLKFPKIVRSCIRYRYTPHGARPPQKISKPLVYMGFIAIFSGPVTDSCRPSVVNRLILLNKIKIIRQIFRQIRKPKQAGRKSDRFFSWQILESIGAIACVHNLGCDLGCGLGDGRSTANRWADDRSGQGLDRCRSGSIHSGLVSRS